MLMAMILPKVGLQYNFIMKPPFIWDRYSDQPYQLKDRAFKKRMRRAHRGDFVMMVLTALFIIPLGLLFSPFLRRRTINTPAFFGMSINVDKSPELTPSLVEELGVHALLIRLPLWEMDTFDDTVDFIHQFKDKKLLINVMQDREHIENLDLFKQNITLVFKHLSPYAQMFQIGTTINRAKWGFFSISEYLAFYRVAYAVKKEQFPHLKLMGPSVIDFEYHFTARALFNVSPLQFDSVAALLYVDRRGAPENTQMGFDLMRKIKLLAAMVKLSPKTASQLYLTETNWPLSGTAPYAPTSEHECVSETDYADFMVRYYLLSFASGQVDAVFWHQLIAPGYGLIDTRNGLRKRSAFYAFKTLLHHLNNATFVNFSQKGTFYTLRVFNAHGTFDILWDSHTQRTIEHTYVKLFSQNGKALAAQPLTLSASVVYAYVTHKGDS